MSEKSLIEQLIELAQNRKFRPLDEVLVVIPARWLDIEQGYFDRAKYLVPIGIDNEVLLFKAIRAGCNFRLSEWIDTPVIINPYFAQRLPYAEFLKVESLEERGEESASRFWNDVHNSMRGYKI